MEHSEKESPQKRKLRNEAGVEKIKFYDMRCDIIGTFGMICVMYDKSENIVSSGIAITSLEDHFVRKEGKHKSFMRAMKAALSEKTSEEMVPIFERKNSGKPKLVKRKIKLDKDPYLIYDKLDAIASSYNEAGEDHKYTFARFYRSLTVDLTLASLATRFKSHYKPIVIFKNPDEEYRDLNIEIIESKR